jgi:hypothetical protein
MIGYDLLPRSKWVNEYPIVLVHGYCGWAPDEGQIYGDYWTTISDPKLAEYHKIY